MPGSLQEHEMYGLGYFMQISLVSTNTWMRPLANFTFSRH